jgi:hypothetical protein
MRCLQIKEATMTTRHTIALIRLGSAKSLTQANLPTGEIEPEDGTDKYGV